MDWLEKNEHFWQRLFDSIFKRGAEVPVQPVEIAKKLVKKMNSQRTISINNVYVPNIYTVYLSLKDFEHLSAFEASLAKELADYLRKKAADQNYTMVGEPRVEMEVEEELAPGEVRIHARLEEIRQQTKKLEEHTLTYQPVSEEKRQQEQSLYTLKVIVGPDKGRTFLIRSEKQILGRQPACDFILTDEQVSRRHCQFEENHDRVLLTDLGSKNGTLVNGEKIDRVYLNPGDRIQVGRTVLEIQNR